MFHQHEDFWAQAEQVGTLLLEWATTHSAPDGSLNATMVLQVGVICPRRCYVCVAIVMTTVCSNRLLACWKVL